MKQACFANAKTSENGRMRRSVRPLTNNHVRMRTSIFIYGLLAATMGLSVLFLTSCKEDEEIYGTPRLFRPAILDATVTANKINYTWNAIDSAVNYTIELSKDSFLTNPIKSIIVETNSFKFEGLDYVSYYYARVKANRSDTTLNSKFAYFAKIKTLTKVSARVLLKADVDYFNQLTFNWVTDVKYPVTHIRIDKASDGTLVTKYALTSADLANGTVSINGLAGGTSYMATILNDAIPGVDGEYNTMTFKTNSDLAGTVITLNPNNPADSLHLVLADPVRCPEGSIIYLPAGSHFGKVAGVPVERSVTIACKENGARPRINYTEFNISGSLNHLRFVGVELSGFKVDASGNETGTMSGYIINLKASAPVFSRVDEILFEDCYIHDVGNAVIRHQSASVAGDDEPISNLIVNNCLITKVGTGGNYSLFHAAGSSGGYIANFTLKNSTIYSIDKGIFESAGNNSLGKKITVTIENSTINNLGQNATARYLFDFDGCAAGSALIIRNSIFGKLGVVYKGLRSIPANVSFNVTTSWSAADFVPASNPIPGLTATEASAAIFEAPLTGNFTLTNTILNGAGAGDPRWIK